MNFAEQKEAEKRLWPSKTTTTRQGRVGRGSCTDSMRKEEAGSQGCAVRNGEVEGDNDDGRILDDVAADKTIVVAF